MPVLHWGSNAAGDDPFLDVDDVDGLGPEVISVLAPEQGQTYTVGLHMYRLDIFSAGDPTTASLKIFVDGEVVAEAEHVMPSNNDWWEAFRITWDAEVEVEVELVDNYSDNAPGPTVP